MHSGETSPRSQLRRVNSKAQLGGSGKSVLPDAGNDTAGSVAVIEVVSERRFASLANLLPLTMALLSAC